MAVARIVMQDWSENYNEILDNSGLLTIMMSGYVDDNRQLTRLLAMGMRYNKDSNRFEMDEEAKKEDTEAREKGEHRDQRMARICRVAMKSVNPDLDFTVETAQDYKDKYLPTLEFKTKITELGIIIHTYYQKPMKTPFILMEASAMADQQKYQILTNELIRRLSLIDIEHIDMKDILEVVEVFIQEMKSSEYKREKTREVVVGGIKGWKRKIQRRKDEGSDFYRHAKSTLKSRNYKKLMEKETWFKQKHDEKKDTGDKSKDEGPWRSRRTDSKKGERKGKKDTIKAVITVPYTTNSELAKELREGEYDFERINGWRLKVVERTGRSLQDMLTTSNPWRGKDCEREACRPCDTKEKTGKNKNQDCSRRSLVYESWCMNCEKKENEKIDKMEDKTEKEKKVLKKKIILFKYLGEGARSLYERAFEHFQAKESLRFDSHMLKHAVAEPEEEDLDKVQFGIWAVVFCRSSFERQITESCKIQEERRHHILLNSRAEYNRCAVPRASTKLGDNEYDKVGKEIRLEKINEDIIEEKIKRLRKQRNVERRPTDPNVENKRRKLNNNNYEEKKSDWGKPEKRNEGEKRTMEGDLEKREKKRLKQTKIGENIPKKPTLAEKPLDPEYEKKVDEELEKLASKYKNDPRFHNLEEIEEKRNKARKELENKKRERIEKATILEMSWSLARICKEILSEFPGEWDDIKEIEKNGKKDRKI